MGNGNVICFGYRKVLVTGFLFTFAIIIKTVVSNCSCGNMIGISNGNVIVLWFSFWYMFANI